MRHMILVKASKESREEALEWPRRFPNSSSRRVLANGTATHEIARCLSVTVPGVDARLAALFEKMGAATRPDAVAAAFRRGLLPAACTSTTV
jgi:DNA-binding NarL/FixJ family response regulator